MLDYYTKKTKKDDDDCTKFLGIKNKASEEKIKKNIDKCYENIVTNYIKEKFSSSKKIKIDDKCITILIRDIKKIINYISPSFRDLKDSMNINDYIKVKILRTEEFSTRVIEGFAMTKNVCCKKMREKQEAPKILILDLDLNEHKTKLPLKLNDEVEKDSYNIDDIKKKIEALEIDVILLKKGIGNLLLESLLKNSKLIIIVNVKSSSLKKIARCTKGEVITSLNDFLEFDPEKNNQKENLTKLSSNLFGTCKVFQIIDAKNSKEKKSKNNIKFIINDFSTYTDSNKKLNKESKFNKLILSKNHKLMIFDGCNNILFQTLLLYGKEGIGLSEIKRLLKNEIFSTVREFFLEKKLLYFLFCSIPPNIKDKDNNSKSPDNNEESKIRETSSVRGISNDAKLKSNPFLQVNLLKNKFQNNIEKVFSSEIESKIKAEDFQVDSKKLERKVSEHLDNENNTKLQKKSNFSSILSSVTPPVTPLIKNISDKEKKDEEEIKKLNLLVNNIKKTYSEETSKSKNPNQRNLSNFINMKNNENKEDEEIHSNSNINNILSKELGDIPKPEIIKANFTLSQNNNEPFSPNTEKSEIQGENLISPDNDGEFNKALKFYSNKLISKVKEDTEHKIESNREQSKSIIPPSNFQLENYPNNTNKSNNNSYSNSYQNGFDISPILTNKSSLKLIRLTMCKGESNFSLSNAITNSENSFKAKNKNLKMSNSLTENALLKSLNFICENMEVLNLVYYKSKYSENNKSLSKAIIDIISEIDKPLESIISNKIEDNNTLRKTIIDAIEEKDKFLSKIIIEMITEKDNRTSIETIEEKDKFYGKQVIDILTSDNNKNLAKYIINIIAEKDKNFSKMIIDMIKEAEKPLDNIFIDMIVEKDKTLGKKIIDSLEEKHKPFCEKIIELISEKDKKLGKAIIDMIAEKDKPLGKMIIDMAAEKDNRCNKCKNIMNNHFYYLYNSNFSRIKIDFLSSSDTNLEKIINFVNKKNEDFKKFYFENAFAEKKDYNSDIYIYGFCKQCKEIVTPLIKMPKDLFNYSSAKFFKHIFNNQEVSNRTDVKIFNISSFIGNKKCNHSSFQDINRIFVTRYGSLRFQYENIIKYDLISVQNISDISHIKHSSKQIYSSECLGIINLIKDNFSIELEEIKNIQNKSNINNITFFNSLKIQPQSFIELANNLITNILDYLGEEIKEKELKEISISISNISDIDTENIKEPELKKRISELKKNLCSLSNETFTEISEELKKEKDLLSKSEKEKIFPNIINNCFKKCDDYSKANGLIKRLFFKIVRIKVLYNKIRSIINILKIFISLELIIREEENKNKNKILDLSIVKSKTPKPAFKIPETIINNHKVENDPNKIFGPLELQPVSSQSNESSNLRRSFINNTTSSNNNINKEISDNNQNIINEKDSEKCPFKSNPRNILKSNSESIDLKDEKAIELKLNLEKNNSSKDKNIKLNINANAIPNTENEEKIEISPENLIKSLIDKYVSIFNYKDNYKNINENEDYSKMLKIINFYDELQNENSGIIKEKDLSSIVSYAISSAKYKAFIKEKTILLEIKRNYHHPKDSNKTLPFLLMENSSKDNSDKKDLNENNDSKTNETLNNTQNDYDRFLYNTLLLFDSSNISYTIQSTEQKGLNPQPMKNKINRMLEAEILCKDKTPFIFHINSINPKKFEIQTNVSRKMTISRQTINTPMASPAVFSPTQKLSESEKSYKIIEGELEQIDTKINKFYEDVHTIEEHIKNIKKSNKIESISKSLNLSNNVNLLNNINTEELLSQNNNNNINNSILEIRKKELMKEFISSFNNSQNVKKENIPEFAKKPNDNEINLIDAIGKIYFPEELIPELDIEVIVYYPRQFEALRIAYCCTYEDLLLSITKSNEWTDVSGGKSKASFYKTNDEKYLFKSINKNEFDMFLDIGFYYFQHIDEYLFHKMPSVLMKILGVYKIKIKKTENGQTRIENYYLMMMENLNYGFNGNLDNIKSYDLKGSTINRYVKKKEKKFKDNIVLLDSNFKKDFNNEPIPLEKDLYGLLLVSVYNDTLFLSKMGIVDYSLLLYIKNIDDYNSIIRVGIIDYIRRYTWDKKLEHFVKTIINGFNSPTIINPTDYKERFISAIKSYFIGI